MSKKYCLVNHVTEDTGPIFDANNDLHAVRMVRSMLAKAVDQPGMDPTEYSLYYVGDIYIEDGRLYYSVLDDCYELPLVNMACHTLDNSQAFDFSVAPDVGTPPLGPDAP